MTTATIKAKETATIAKRTDSSPSDASYTRSQIAELICNGHVLVIRNGSIYRLNNWLHHHPGGYLAILHMVGRDATDEIAAYHAHIDIEERLKGFLFGKVIYQEDAIVSDDSDDDAVVVKSPQNIWRPLMPPVQLGYKLQHSKEGSYWAPVKPSLTASLSALSIEPPSLHGSAVDLSAQHRISLRYRSLHGKIKRANLYQCDWRNYAREAARYTLFASFAFGFYYYATASWHYIISSIFLGIFWHQLTFTVHDAGHLAITHDYTTDNLIGILIADFIGGLSVGWWVHNHDVHHIVTNHPEHDPDIQHLPFFAINERFFDTVFSTYYGVSLPFDKASRVFITLQHRLYYIVMAFARFNLYALSYTFLARQAWKTVREPTRRLSRRQLQTQRFLFLEIFGIIVFWSWFSFFLSTLPNWKIRIAYLLISHIVTSPLHVQITLSHFGMSVTDFGPKESFAARQLRTTMDVDCPEYLDPVHGGLHMQVSHHLFPRLPRHNLRAVRDLVKSDLVDTCEPNDDPNVVVYHEYAFVEGNKKVLSVLENVANQARLLGKVAAWQREEDLGPESAPAKSPCASL